MKRCPFIYCMLLCLLLTSFAPPSEFLAEQKKYERVKTAFREKENTVTAELKANSLDATGLNILLRAFKTEGRLELYAKKKMEAKYKLLKTYSICSPSGQLGPKRRQGDYQVPEGFYYIDRFNPTSNFYLSLGLNYPNASDRKKSTAKNPGGDVFIHGSCVTIGCMPVTDDKIKEIYLYALLARSSGQLKIPVYVFPFAMNDINYERYKTAYKKYPDLLSFWSNLKTGYDKFDKGQKELTIAVDETGNYQF